MIAALRRWHARRPIDLDDRATEAVGRLVALALPALAGEDAQAARERLERALTALAGRPVRVAYARFLTVDQGDEAGPGWEHLVIGTSPHLRHAAHPLCFHFARPR